MIEDGQPSPNFNERGEPISLLILHYTGMETGEIAVARVNQRITFPARFQLIAAMNPCRCGYLDDPSLACTRAPKCAGDYQSKISGPLFDRIDCHVDVPAVSPADLSLPPPAEDRVHVVEVSSFQIDLAPTLDPTIGCLLNITPDHLDRHGTLAHYASVKERLVAGARTALVGVDDAPSDAIGRRLSERPGSDVYPVSAAGERPWGFFALGAEIRARNAGEALEDARVLADLAGVESLRGRHNAQNAAFAAAAAFLAGGYAGANSARSNVTPEEGAIFFGWDNGSEALYRGDGSSWELVADFSAIGSGGGGGTTDHGNLSGLGDDDHTQYLNSARHGTEDHQAALDTTFPSPNSGDHIAWDGTDWTTEAPPTAGSIDGAETDPQSVNNEVYADEFSGAGLASKVDNALTWLANNVDGRGIVRVTPKDDGTAWNWDTEITIDDSVHHGAQLIIDENVPIDYGGSGVAITIEGEIAERRPGIIGGLWDFSGDPTGWLRLKDCYGCVVSPTQVDNIENSGGTAFGVSIENHDDWSEHTKIRDCFIRGDRCVQFQTASDTGGTGTDSFQETKVWQCHMEGNDWCIRPKGNFKYSSFTESTFRPGANGAKCIWLDHNAGAGWTCTNLKFENTGTNYSNDASFYDPNNNAFYGPLIISPASYRIDNELEGGSALNSFKFYGGNGFEFNRNGEANIYIDGGAVKWGDNGARIELNGSGELVAYDEAGNSTTLT